LRIGGVFERSDSRIVQAVVLGQFFEVAGGHVINAQTDAVAAIDLIARKDNRIGSVPRQVVAPTADRHLGSSPNTDDKAYQYEGISLHLSNKKRYKCKGISAIKKTAETIKKISRWCKIYVKACFQWF
jgi:hypothetical protein